MGKVDDNTADTLLQRIRTVFPDIRWDAYTLITEGWDHHVIMLDKRLIFRFPIEHEYAVLLKAEIEMLRRLRPLVAVNIPNYTYVAPDYSFAGYPLVKGETLYKNYFDGLNPADRTALAKQLADFLSVLHTALQQGRDFGPVSVSHNGKDQAEVRRHTRQYLQGALSKADFVLAQDILAEVDEIIGQKLPSVFIHGDIYHSHLFWDPDEGKLGVIDFSDRSIGDPAHDFAELHEYGDDFVAEVYSYYAGPKDDTFLRRAWTYQGWAAVYIMADHFVNDNMNFAEARRTFDWVKKRWAAKK